MSRPGRVRSRPAWWMGVRAGSAGAGLSGRAVIADHRRRRHPAAAVQDSRRRSPSDTLGGIGFGLEGAPDSRSRQADRCSGRPVVQRGHLAAIVNQGRGKPAEISPPPPPIHPASGPGGAKRRLETPGAVGPVRISMPGSRSSPYGSRDATGAKAFAYVAVEDQPRNSCPPSYGTPPRSGKSQRQVGNAILPRPPASSARPPPRRPGTVALARRGVRFGHQAS